MLGKAEEGRIGAWGVAWSLARVRGLMMDLGGGSTQVSWVLAEEGKVSMCERGSVSMPYGAAALMRRLGEVGERSEGREELKGEIVEAYRKAFEEIAVPSELMKEAKEKGGMDVYLSGGGFRGWGYVLMSQHSSSSYPIPIINGFSASCERFQDTERLQAAVQASQQDETESIFRISERRASQVPAVSFLVQCMAEALQVKIKDFVFSQGGVREGALFETLEEKTRAFHPLTAAAWVHGTDIQSNSTIVNDLRSAFPPPSSTFDGNSLSRPPEVPDVFTPELLACLIPSKIGFAGLDGTKETTAAAALRISTSGALAGVLPLRHIQRAAVALALCARHGGLGSLPPEDQGFFHRMQNIAGAEVGWWCNYIGAVSALLGDVYPAGFGERRLNMKAEWIGETGKDKGKTELNNEGRRILLLRVKFQDDMWREAGEKALIKIEKVGKRKHWIGGRDGMGWKTRVEVC